MPYIICNFSFLIFNNLFVYLNIYTTNFAYLEGTVGNHFGIDKILSVKDFIIKTVYICLLATGTKLGGATWFVKVLFLISIFFAFITYFLKRHIRKTTNFYICGLLMTVILL